MNYRYLFPGMFDYPAGLGKAWRGDQLPVLTVSGDTGPLRQPSICLLSSSEVPPDLILPSFDLALRLRDARVPVAGGFQGEVERVCLNVLLGGIATLVICPARSLDAINLSPPLRDRLAAGRLAYVSSERPTCRRPTAQVAMRRNDLVVGLADRLVVLSAPPGSRVLRSGAEFLERGRPVACFDHRRNRDLLLLGAFPIPPSSPALRPSRLRDQRRPALASDPLQEFLGRERSPEGAGELEPADTGTRNAVATRLAGISRASRACH